MFPLFYDNANGYDFDLYNKLEAEAEYFQVNTFYEWLTSKVSFIAKCERVADSD